MIYYYTQRKETPGFSTHPVSWKPNVVIEEDLLDFVVRETPPGLLRLRTGARR